MPHKIFLSHNHNDKPLVEPVALKLRGIFGEDHVFYDSWSIRPGDGIIEQMNRGLEAPDYVFFFVSRASLESEMVKLEWQNALYKATKGATKLVPVRVDGSDMPAILAQTVYVDMHTNGLEAATAQIVGLAQGDASFTPQHQGFSNLSYTASYSDDGSVEITVSASHLMEPNPNFAFPVMNEKEDIGWFIKNQPGIYGSFRKNEFQLNEGPLANAIVMRPIVGSLTPNHPLTFQFKKCGNKKLEIIDVLHDQGNNLWKQVPVGSKIS
jgi:hypothetical protein